MASRRNATNEDCFNTRRSKSKKLATQKNAKLRPIARWLLRREDKPIHVEMTFST